MKKNSINYMAIEIPSRDINGSIALGAIMEFIIALDSTIEEASSRDGRTL